MEDLILELGVGGIFSLLVIREVLQWQSRRRNGVSEPGVAQKFCHLDAFHEELRRLHVALSMRLESVTKQLDELARQLEKLRDHHRKG